MGETQVGDDVEVVEVKWSEVTQMEGDEKGRCDRRGSELRIGVREKNL
jgi:hypothetical protein